MNALLLAFALNVAAAESEEAKAPSLSFEGLRFEMNLPVYEQGTFTGTVEYSPYGEEIETEKETTYRQAFAASPMQTYMGVGLNGNVEVGLFLDYATHAQDSRTQTFYNSGLDQNSNAIRESDDPINSTQVMNLNVRVAPALSFVRHLDKTNTNFIATVAYQNEWLSQFYVEKDQDAGDEIYYYHLQGFLLRGAFEQKIKESNWGIIGSVNYRKLYEKEAWYKTSCFRDCNSQEKYQDFELEMSASAIHFGVSYSK